MVNLVEHGTLLETWQNGLKVWSSKAISDSGWDEFLRHHVHGHHTQSSFWGRVKSGQGWSVYRLVVTDQQTIRGGAQVLLKSIPALGRVAYVSRGPVFQSCDPSSVCDFFELLAKSLRGMGVRYYAVQPSADDESIRRGLERSELELSPSSISLAATTMLHLEPDESELLRGMKSKTRYNVKIGSRGGMEFRDVGYAGLGKFYELLSMTADRQAFRGMSLDRLQDLYRECEASDRCKVFLVYKGDEVLSGSLVIGFGDTAVYKRGVWSGSCSRLKPNEFMHWSAILWAKANGYRYYDFDGIDGDVARAIDRGESRPVVSNSVTRFKLGFGGEVRILPATFEAIRPKMLFQVYRSLVPIARRFHVLSRAIDAVRSG